jgi:hypothetical protein
MSNLPSYIQAIGDAFFQRQPADRKNSWKSSRFKKPECSGTVPTADPICYLVSGPESLDDADAVHDEYPASHHVELMKTFLVKASSLTAKILPFLQHRLHRFEVRMADLVTWAFAAYPRTSLMKWSVGRPRPGRDRHARGTTIPLSSTGTAGCCERGQAMRWHAPKTLPTMTRDAPSPVLASDAFSPSAASLWLAVVADFLTPDQYCQGSPHRLRSVVRSHRCGVHYTTDNIVSQLGPKILADKLAAHLWKSTERILRLFSRRSTSLTLIE